MHYNPRFPLTKRTTMNDKLQPRFNRPPRVIRQLPRDEIEIPAPPEQTLQMAGNRSLIAVLLPALTGVFYLIALIARGNQGGNIWLSLPIVVISFVSVGVGVWNYLEQKKKQEAELLAYQNNYAEAVNRIRCRLEELTRLQQEVYHANFPDAKALLTIVKPDRFDELPETRLWERRPSDDDFLELRVGIGDRPTSLKLKSPKINEFRFSEKLREMIQLVERFSEVLKVPITFSLPRLGSVGIAGSEQQQTEFTYWLIWQIAVHHSPQEVRLVAFWSQKEDTFWSWLRWLPHTRAFDDDSYRLLAHYEEEGIEQGEVEQLRRVESVLQRELQLRSEYRSEDRPHIIVVFDRFEKFALKNPNFNAVIERGRELGIYTICLVSDMRWVPSTAGGYIKLESGQLRLAIAGKAGFETTARLDNVPLEKSEGLARKLASLSDDMVVSSSELPRVVRFSELLGLKDLAPDWKDPEDPNISWRPVEVGITSFGKPLRINLNEGVHGVHGIIAGTTGSGKSEFLLTFLMALAVRHGPDRLNLLLIDFKGGSTFKDIVGLPHAVGMITDLSGNETERALIAINSELDRRKRLLNEIKVTNIREYRREQQRRNLRPIPNLMIAIDEFDEMMRDFPEFVDELIRVAKQGRSLGVHLLFATQQPSLVKGGLTRNLTYRVALRVTSPDDSKTLLGIPDAAYLTTETPGRGYFRVNKDVYQFQSARITLPYQVFSEDNQLSEIDSIGRRRVRSTVVDQIVDRWQEKHGQVDLTSLREVLREQFSDQKISIPELNEQESQRVMKCLEAQDRQALRDIVSGFIARLQRDADSELILLIKNMQKQIADIHRESPTPTDTVRTYNKPPTTYAARMYRLWQEPLPGLLSLWSFADLLEQPQGWMQVPLGLLDKPEEVTQEPWVYRPLEADGNLLVVGASRSGKTTLLRTLMLGLALAYPPDQLWMYTIDPGGSGCGLRQPGTEDLPHLAGTLTPDDPARLERLLFVLETELEKRRTLLHEYGCDNVLVYHQRRQTEPSLPPTPPVILVVVDGVSNLTEEFSNRFTKLLSDARPYGIILAATGADRKEVNTWQRLCETRVILRLTEVADSDQLLGKGNAARIPTDRPGRAYLRTTGGPVEMQIAAPMLSIPQQFADEINEVGVVDYIGEVRRFVERIGQKYRGVARPDRLELPPDRVNLADLLRAGAAGAPFAVSTLTFEPVDFDIDGRMRHLMIAGGAGTGKSTAVRALLTALTNRFSPRELQMVFISYRGRILQSFANSSFTREWTVNLLDPVPPPNSYQQQLLQKAKEGTIKKGTIRMARSESEVAGLCFALKDELERRRREGWTEQPRLLLVIDDVNLLQGQEGGYLDLLAPYILQSEDIGFHVVLTVRDVKSPPSSKVFNALKTENCVLYLGEPDEQERSNITNIGLKWSKTWSSLSFPEGRGVLRVQNRQEIVQVADVDDETIERHLAARDTAPVAVDASPDGYGSTES